MRQVIMFAFYSPHSVAPLSFTWPCLGCVQNLDGDGWPPRHRLRIQTTFAVRFSEIAPLLMLGDQQSHNMKGWLAVTEQKRAS
jgi:hypothetical protein